MRVRGRGRLPRLAGFDYSSPGFYFVTACTWHRLPIFGKACGKGLLLSRIGQIVHEEWIRSIVLRPTFLRDAFVVMPDHFHALVALTATSDAVVPRGLHRRPRSLSSIMACFKAASTVRINALRGTPGAPVWQSRFHDHVVRDDRALQRIRWYIQNNPRKLLEKLGLDWAG